MGIETDRKGEKEEKLTIYYAKPKPNVLIAASNESFLRTTLQLLPLTQRTPVLDPAAGIAENLIED